MEQNLPMGALGVSHLKNGTEYAYGYVRRKGEGLLSLKKVR